MKKLGAQTSLEFVDVFGVDEALLAMVPQPVRAVLLLFPLSKVAEEHRKQEQETIDNSESTQTVSENVWFTKQTVPNACGTVGLLHAVFNNRQHIKFGTFLAGSVHATLC